MTRISRLSAEPPCPRRTGAIGRRKPFGTGVSNTATTGLAAAAASATTYAIPSWQTNINMTANHGLDDHAECSRCGADGGQCLGYLQRRLFRGFWRHQLRRAVVGGVHGVGQPAGGGQSASPQSASSTRPSMPSPRGRITRTVFTTSPPATTPGAAARTCFMRFPAMTFAPAWARPTEPI